MRNLILAGALIGAAAPVISAAPAIAQGTHERHATRDCRRDLRNSETNREYRRELRDCDRDISRAQRRDWRTYRNYDYNRYERGASGYYADQYYRADPTYRERR